MKRPAVFFDRDNTLIACDGFLGDPEKVVLVDGAADAVSRVKELGFAAVVFSNQSGVARGMFSEEAVHAVNHRLDDLLLEDHPTAVIDRHDFCPFHPTAKVERYRVDSDLRKPNPGMIYRAERVLNLDLARSWVVGDAPRDIAAGHAAGLRTVLLKIASLPPSPATKEGAGVEPDFVATSLHEAVEVIERESRAEVDKSSLIASPAESLAETVANPPPSDDPVSAATEPPTQQDSGTHHAQPVSRPQDVTESPASILGPASDADIAVQPEGADLEMRALVAAGADGPVQPPLSAELVADEPASKKPAGEVVDGEVARPVFFRPKADSVRPATPKPVPVEPPASSTPSTTPAVAPVSAEEPVKLTPRHNANPAARPAPAAKPAAGNPPSKPVQGGFVVKPNQPTMTWGERMRLAKQGDAVSSAAAAATPMFATPTVEVAAPKPPDPDVPPQAASAPESPVAEAETAAAAPSATADTVPAEAETASQSHEPPSPPDGPATAQDVSNAEVGVDSKPADPVAPDDEIGVARAPSEEVVHDDAVDSPVQDAAREEPVRGWRREDDAAEKVAQTSSPTPTGDLSRVERLLEQLLEEMRRREDLAATDFSVSKLMAGITQVLALAALFYAYFNKENSTNLQTTLLVGLVLQTLTISLLIMGRQR